MRALLAAVAALVVLAPSSARAADSGDAATQAAKEIADARDRANAAADALFETESRLDALELQQEDLQAQIDVLQQQIDGLQANIEAVAVNRFTRAGSESIPLLTGFEKAGEQEQMDVLVDVVNETSADAFDAFDALSKQLGETRSRLRASQQEAGRAKVEMEQRSKDALAEVQRLKEVEGKRLQDEAVRKALAAEQAARRSRAAEVAAAEAEQAKANDPLAAAVNDETTVPGVNDDDDNDAAPSIPRSVAGSSGGLTGKAGPGGRPGASPGILGGPGWACPVQGSVSFGDTWGAPRSGGRTHQGVDMIGESGLPLVAVVDGIATAKVNTLGGRTVSLNGVDGARYYYAHLEDWANLGSVRAGEVIGYLGQTGNAAFSVPHLHFEIHPNGGPAVNPYPTVAAFC